MDEKIFVVKDKIYRDLIRTTEKRFPNNVPQFYNFSWRGKKIYSKSTIISSCVYRAEQEIQSSKEYQNKVQKRAIEISRKYKWVKDNKKWSRCGKWIKEEINNG